MSGAVFVYRLKMIYLIILFTILFFILAWRRLDLAVMFLIAALPAYLIRFNVFGLPSTLLSVMIWVVFIVWVIKNFSRVKNNFLENFKKENKKIKIRYPFAWEMVLLLLIAFMAADIANFSASSLGIWKAYFFEPVILFIVVLNIMKGEKGKNKILSALAVSALAVSFLAVYQKITGQLIDNSLWAAAATRRVVSFFGYPNAVGLYLGPLVLVMIGWLTSVILVGRNDKEKSVVRNDIIAIIFISLTIITSVLAIYFTKSKGAMMGVASGLVVFGLMANKKIRWAVIIILILISALIASNQPLRHRALKYLTLNDFSGQVRRAQWHETWQMLTDGRVLTGAGLANYQATIINYHIPGMFIKNFDDPDAQRKLVFNNIYRAAHWQPLEIYLYPHNIFLNFWSELGLAGLLLFVWIIGKFFVIGICDLFGNLEMQKNKYLLIGLISAMIVIVMHGAVDVPYFKNDLSVIFWLLVAMASLINLEN